jgi:hypothetical protein
MSMASRLSRRFLERPMIAFLSWTAALTASVGYLILLAKHKREAGARHAYVALLMAAIIQLISCVFCK